MPSIQLKESAVAERSLDVSLLPANMLDLLRREYRKIDTSANRLRYNRLAGVHNPWGKAANVFDSWALLDICQSPHLLDPVSELIGPDVFLWDSRFYRLTDLEPDAAWLDESNYAPIDPLVGVTVHITLQKSGEIVCHDLCAPYRYADSNNSGEYIIQYASARSRFVREQASAIQQQLAERLPLVNFGQAPIWLVRGTDHAENDFATGFAPAVPQWAAGTQGSNSSIVLPSGSST